MLGGKFMENQKKSRKIARFLYKLHKWVAKNYKD
jgi:hypothetical protein